MDYIIKALSCETTRVETKDTEEMEKTIKDGESQKGVISRRFDADGLYNFLLSCLVPVFSCQQPSRVLQNHKELRLHHTRFFVALIVEFLQTFHSFRSLSLRCGPFLYSNQLLNTKM